VRTKGFTIASEDRLFRNPGRASDQFTATIGAGAFQNLVGTASAKCAFKGTDHRVFSVLWQADFALLTIDLHLQHCTMPPVLPNLYCETIDHRVIFAAFGYFRRSEVLGNHCYPVSPSLANRSPLA
jgi:hypothetical protein